MQVQTALIRALAAAGCVFDALLVSLGAVPGTWLRLRVVNHFQPVVPHKHWGTFVVNLTAAFFLGLFAGLHTVINNGCVAPSDGSPIMLLVGVGFFGSLSTFSTFAVELLGELQSRHWGEFITLAVASVIGGLLIAGAGYRLAFFYAN